MPKQVVLISPILNMTVTQEKFMTGTKSPEGNASSKAGTPLPNTILNTYVCSESNTPELQAGSGRNQEVAFNSFARD
jgi:hypothetical protein